MRRNLYDLGDKDTVRVIDTVRCYINIDPLCEGDEGKMTEISEKDILLALPGEERPHVIRLEGQPGVGKTALTHHIVYDWSIEFLSRMGEAIPIEIGGDLLTMMVYVAGREIKTTVDAAIYDNLRCPREDKAIPFDHVTKGNGTTIVLEALDEIRDMKVMENVQEYVKERQMSHDGPQVLVTARTDFCPINIQHIDRFVTVKGFSISQGFSYIKAYLNDDHKMRQKVLDYVDAHQHQLFAIITNPLRLHIFCTLVSEGELELDDTDNFCILKLFTLLEKCLLKREGKEVTDSELHSFYRMCLFRLLNGLREFPKELLDRFHVGEACHVFFTKKDITDIFGKHLIFSFPHETIYEFFAAKYIATLSLAKKKSLLLAVCSKPEFTNLQKIMFEVILQQEQHQQELLLLLIRAIFILQHEPPQSPQSWKSDEGRFRKMKRLLLWQAQYNELTLLKSKVQPVDSVATKLLLDHEQPAEAKNTSKICSKVYKAFDGNSNFLREVKWYHGLGHGVFGHVSACLLGCDPEQRITLTRETTERLLPCKYEDKKGQHMVHTVGGSRWAEVVQPQDYLPQVHAWCPADVQEVLYKVRMSGYTTGWSWLDVFLTTYQDTWGQVDSSAFCTQALNELYEELVQWKGTGTESKVTYCRLYLGPSPPLQGVLQSDIGHILWRLHHGTIGIEELYQVYNAPHLPYTERCVRMDCNLWHTTIVVPAGGDKSALSKMKDELLSNDSLNLIYPKFVSETGEEYDWS